MQYRISVFVSVEQTAFCNDLSSDLRNIIATDIREKLQKYQAKAFFYIDSSGLVAYTPAVFLIIMKYTFKGRQNIGCFHYTMTSVRDTVQMIVKASDHQKDHSFPVSIAGIVFVNKSFSDSRRILFDRMIFQKRTKPRIKPAIVGE